MRNHHYQINLIWTGNKGQGTRNYTGYERSHTLIVPGKADILGSSDPNFRGDNTKHNPEELFVSSLAACHMLWYLHLCAVAGVIVVNYTDNAAGTMTETDSGSGHFTEVILQPQVTVAEASMIAKAIELHHEAHKMCFIANSCNFPVKHEPVITAI